MSYPFKETIIVPAFIMRKCSECSTINIRAMGDKVAKFHMSIPLEQSRVVYVCHIISFSTVGYVYFEGYIKVPFSST